MPNQFNLEFEPCLVKLADAQVDSLNYELNAVGIIREDLERQNNAVLLQLVFAKTGQALADYLAVFSDDTGDYEVAGVFHYCQNDFYFDMYYRNKCAFAVMRKDAFSKLPSLFQS